MAIHQIVKREAGVPARRGQHLKESAVIAVGWIVVSRAAEIAEAQPWLEFRRGRLPSGFKRECAGAMIEHAPASIL